MGRTGTSYTLGLHDLVELLQFKWAALVHPEIGETNEIPYEQMLQAIDKKNNIELSASQIADLVYSMKEVVFERAVLKKPDATIKNHNVIMRRLKRGNPHLFKELPSGEIVMVNYEVRD